MNSRTIDIQNYILSQVEKHPANIAAYVCKHFSISRMTATRHLQSLMIQGKIIKSGKTSDTAYYLASNHDQFVRLKLDPDCDEFDIYKKYLLPTLAALPKNQLRLCEYCCTELINNAKDHSQGTHLQLKIQHKTQGLHIEIIDNGIGIFKKIQRFLHLADLQESLLALTKGKLTTDPKHHTGEGIFFSSRMADQFTVEANHVFYLKNNVVDDWTYKKSSIKIGTKITLFFARQCKRDIKKVFEAYTDQDDMRFEKTEILVELSKLGDEHLISRSQAKRLLTDLDQFSRILLDFRGIETVGQGFVDEIFRVYQNSHPETHIDYCHANDHVVFMIKRGSGVR